jgi:hypothetical protein
LFLIRFSYVYLTIRGHFYVGDFSFYFLRDGYFCLTLIAKLCFSICVCVRERERQGLIVLCVNMLLIDDFV